MQKVSLSSRTHRATAWVDVEVDVSLTDVDSEHLIEELELRGDLPQKLPKTLEAFPAGTMADLLDLMERGEFEEALLDVRSLLRPRWKTKDECEEAYKRAKRA